MDIMKSNLVIFLLHYFAYRALSQPAREGMCSINFDPKNWIVHFAPWVLDTERSEMFDESDLIQMIQIISTRFATIHTLSVTNRDMTTRRSHIYIPSAVAKFNALQASSDNNNNVNPTKKIKTHLKVMFRFDLYPNGSSPQDKNSSFYLVRKFANEANSIFSGTVQTLILDADDLDETNADQFRNQIDYAKYEIIKNNKFPYKLGISFHISACRRDTGEWMQNFINHVTDLSDFMLFYIQPGSDSFRDGVQISVHQFVKEITKCKKRLQRRKPGLKVGLRISWSDTDSEGKQNFPNLVGFWGKMNQFATSTNTTVVINEAFDQPFRNRQNPRFAHQGWWKINKSIILLTSSKNEYIFDEKCEAHDRMNTEKPGGHTFGMMEIVIVSISTVLLFGLLLLTILFLYRKMRKYKSANKTRDAQIHEFFNGRQSLPDNDFYRETNKVDNFAYDKNHEIDASFFTIDQSVPLGSGEFGSVCLGKVQKDDMKIPTAVKVAKKNTPVCLRSLMCEIKVLSYIGDHENIVRLIGAYTAQLKKGTLMIFLELCPHGSLFSYLKRYRDIKFRGDVVSYLLLTEDDQSIGNAVDINVMIQWCRDILNGMVFLASKSLVHADLATRNILLDRDRRAKICDFGLSRRLYDYASYVKSKVEPLPWRWMSPESLRRWEFNEKSDVWAFGVTVWEIFSFGDIPYPGLSWTIDFPNRLEAGLRLLQPPNCPPDLYDKMIRCWNTNPLSRPTFSQLANEFMPDIDD